jgi:hypothetical protein
MSQSICCSLKINAQNTIFKKLARFNSVYFEDMALFKSSTFKNKVIFSHSTFNKKADFDDTVFEDTADFIDTTFCGEALFENTMFKIANFTFTTFLNLAHFVRSNINSFANFQSTTFRCEAHFSGAVFNDYTSFKKAIFFGEANFAYSVFKGETQLTDLTLSSNKNLKIFSLEGSRLETTVYFSLATLLEDRIQNLLGNNKVNIRINKLLFKENGCIVIDYDKHTEEQHWQLHIHKMECDGDTVRLKIRNVSAESKAKIDFKDCHFYGKNVAFTNVAMKNVRIEGGNTVKGMLFDHCDFDTITPYEWLLGDLHFRSLTGEEQWLNSTDPEKLKERALVYASLKTTATEGGETQLANDFHFWQQYYQGKCKSSPWNTMYKYTSAYGLDVILPVFWFIRVLVTFACVYALLLNPIAPITLFYIGFGSLLPILIEDNINPSLRKKVYFIRICLFLIGLVLLVGLDKGLPLSFSGSFPFVFADNDTIKELLPSIPETFSITWASGKVLLFYLSYIFQHLLQGFLLFQIGAAIRNKVKR